MKCTWLFFLVLLIIPVQGQGANYQDFEFTDDVENHGYEVRNTANSELEVTTDKGARYFGDYGLRVKVKGGDGSLFVETPMGYSNINGINLYLSLYSFHIDSVLGIRVSFLQSFDEPLNILRLVFGPPITGWQMEFYNTGYTFSKGEWNFDSIDLLHEAELALADDNSPWIMFAPNIIQSIELVVSAHSLISVESCIDELRLTRDPLTAAEGDPGTCVDSNDLNEEPTLPIPYSSFWIAPILLIPLLRKINKF